MIYVDGVYSSQHRLCMLLICGAAVLQSSFDSLLTDLVTAMRYNIKYGVKVVRLRVGCPNRHLVKMLTILHFLL